MTKVNEKAVSMQPEMKKLFLGYFEKFDGSYIEVTLYDLLQDWMYQDQGIKNSQKDIAKMTFFITETCMMLRRLEIINSKTNQAFQLVSDMFEIAEYDELEDNLHVLLQAFIAPDNVIYALNFFADMIFILRKLIAMLYAIEKLLIDELGPMIKCC